MSGADEERRKLTENEAALLVKELHAAVGSDDAKERIEPRIVRALLQEHEAPADIAFSKNIPRFFPSSIYKCSAIDSIDAEYVSIFAVQTFTSYPFCEAFADCGSHTKLTGAYGVMFENKNTSCPNNRLTCCKSEYTLLSFTCAH